MAGKPGRSGGKRPGAGRPKGSVEIKPLDGVKQTTALRHLVAVAAGAGMAFAEIALSLGIPRQTLNERYGTELSAGACRKRLEVLLAMHAAAKRGNVSAMKTYMALTPKVAPPPVPAPASQGKKQRAQAAAETAEVGTGWEGLLH